jgi:hypothetical protein
MTTSRVKPWHAIHGERIVPAVALMGAVAILVHAAGGSMWVAAAAAFLVGYAAREATLWRARR